MGNLAVLSNAELALLHDLPRFQHFRPKNSQLRVEGRLQPPQLLLEGWAQHERTLRNGRRQIIRLILPGDAIGSFLRPAMMALTRVKALTPVVVTDARPLLQKATQTERAGITDALVRMEHEEELGMQDQVVRLGIQTAYERIVHLLLELHDRLSAIGHVEANSFALRLKQKDLGDILGFSSVHANRTWHQIVSDGLLKFQGRRVTILDMKRMRAVAEGIQTPE